ncbi:hypothetical protein DACRYDRAFT_94059 [Dacryopinax primogenitus]|uniref:Uncharacterized protein n=1 Tax=Dacryopinax primogenitus (strain DJM 731) TaxID=1858805 RepID=M5G5B3_DACPD|nr:uncharacterized protein DACRYDRAFT_94059 [Dacryopinax primogenitus]EJU03864.1 hypothetical protein DACRYDRAFT_94059 [Dacryopinax primogenitus]
MICYDTPSQYGLLSGCSHVFCLTCMRGWRDVKDKELSMLESGVVKACPVCRVKSRFVTPSSQFYPEGHPKKQEMVAAYKASMARVPCRYFASSLQRNPPRPYCPYGRECFYEHKLPTGEVHEFPHGADYYMTVQRERTQRQRRSQFGRNLELLTDAVFTAGMAGHSGADIRRELETDGFWNEIFAGMGWDIETQGPPAGIEGPLPPPPGPGRSFAEMTTIRRLLSTLANNLDGNYYDDGDDDEIMPSFQMLRPAVTERDRLVRGVAEMIDTAREQEREREHTRTPHNYFGPRPPSPHPVAARSSPASESGRADPTEREAEREEEEQPTSARARSSSRRSSYYGPRPPSPHPSAAVRSAPASVHGGDDMLPLDIETDEEESESEEEEAEHDGASADRTTWEEVRAARVRRFGAPAHVTLEEPAPPPYSPRVSIVPHGAEVAQVPAGGSRQNPNPRRGRNADFESSESELSDGSYEDEDSDEDDGEEELWRGAISAALGLRGGEAQFVLSAPAAPVHSSFAPQTLEQALHLQDDIRARIRLVPDGAASRPVIPVPRIARSSRGSPEYGFSLHPAGVLASSSRGGLNSAGAASSRGGVRIVGSPPRPPYMYTPLSEDLRSDWGPAAAHEDDLDEHGSAGGAASSGSLASRLISGLFRRDAGQERRAG